MKRNNYRGIFWGIALIAAAILLILDALSVKILWLHSEIPLFKLGVCALIFAWAVKEVVKGKISHIFVPAGLIFIILQKYISLYSGYGGENFVSPWLVILAALMLQTGTAFICRGFGCKNRNIANHRGNTRLNSCKKGENSVENKLGSSVHYIDAAFLNEYTVSNKTGSLDVYIENGDAYPGGGTLYIENKIGNITLHVPSSWEIIDRVENSMGNVTNGSTAKGGALLTICGHNGLGNLDIIVM